MTVLLPLGNSKRVRKWYDGHKHYHEGDSGLDLFFVHNQTLPRKQVTYVKIGSKASAWLGDVNVGWQIVPRSSIAETPLRLANSVGVIDAQFRGEVFALWKIQVTCPMK